MFLKSLTLHGFKSFAGRTTLELAKGVAAVVGPNGSGKSNIADAIRWVLGEQSIRLLRGAKLEDVIFAGSESKKSLGMAEVTLTFDNSQGKIPLEYSEVTVTRRVYRSGESEFLINRSPCRLKDIQELFLDTGLGRGSLSIIGQGEVEAILSARPEERRAFLEEAAGVSKYRVKKREALLKLSQTEENLIRLEDIIQEVESRLGPLAAQAEAARVYEAIERRLKDVEIRLLSSELRALKRGLEANDRALDERNKARDEAEKVTRALELKLAELTGALDALDEETAQLHARMQEIQRRELAAQHKGELARSRIERAAQDRGDLERRLEGHAERIARLISARERVHGELSRAQEALAPKENALKSLEESLAGAAAELAGTERALDGTKRELSAATERLIQLESRSESLQREASRRGDAESELAARREHRAREHELHLQAVETAKRRLAEVEEAYSRERERVAHLEREAASVRSERLRAGEALSATRARIQDLSARREALSEMEAAREGYHRGVREALAAAKRRGWGLKGAVAELVRVDREFETAIETALGGAAQYIVAERDEDARQAILHLKETRAGRATFLPLNTLRVHPLPAEAKRALAGISGVVGVASELVQVEEVCRPAIEYLLGRVVVTRDLDAAMAVGRRVNGVNRAVTLDGDVVVPGGAMTGGSRPGRSDGLIGRSRQLEELSLAVAQEKEKAQGLSRTLSELDERASALAASLGQAEEARRHLEIQRITAERDLKEAERDAERSRRELDALERESERLVRDQAERQKEAAALDSERAQVAERRKQLENEVDRLQNELAERRAGHEGMRRDAESLRLSVLALRQQIEQLTREEMRISGELAEAERAAGEERARLAKLEEEREEAGTHLQEAAEEGKQAALEREESERRLEALRLQKKTIKEEADSLAARAREAQGVLTTVSEEVTRLLVERERLEIAKEQVVEQLSVRGVGDLEAAAGGDEPVDTGALKAEARKLRRELEQLGPVNLGAVAEYEEVKQRHAFLSAQRADLLEAKEKLDQVIARIDKESVEKLQSVMAAVRAAFAATFARLFGGGKADLQFTDPSDPLESGLEILVQPPGKRLQNLMALSGGEKALAAIALLFALLEVKPSPFCVLDEIDAALDEHNLERFRALLVEYSEHTQFLVITHRQVTMEGADTLFGVTMEESGVSTLVSLDLAQVKSAS